MSGGRGGSLALVAGGIACLSAALLVRTWGVPYLVLMGAATAVTLLLGASRAPRLQWRVWLALLLGLASASFQGWLQRRAVAAPQAGTVSESTTDRLSREADAIFPELRTSAQRLLDITLSTPRAGRVAQIEAVLPSPARGEAAAVVLDQGRPVAWAGLVRLPLDSMTQPAGVARSEFYVVAYAREQRGERTSIAMRTLQALPPADRLSRSFAHVAAVESGLERVELYGEPPGIGVLPLDGVPALWLRAVPRDPARVGFALEERARLVVVALLAAAVLAGLWVVWVSLPLARARLAALAVSLAVIAAAPLSTLSNPLPVFNAAYYFSPLAGPFTASVGALGLAGAVACLAVFVGLRRRGTPLPDVVVLLPAVAAVLGGPFLLRYLARGLTLPPRGVPTQLWIAWDIALFLVAAAVLFSGLWATGRLRGPRVPNGSYAGAIAAALAALLAPLVWQADSRFPVWYQGLWMLAIALVVFSRTSRALTVHAAWVAACGATILVWSSVTRKRVELAERDVAQLTLPDMEVQPLLERLLMSVRAGELPRTRADLLKAWVGTELAASGVPVELAVWTAPTADQGPDAELVIAQLERRVEGERTLVRLADSARTEVLRDVGSIQGVQLVVAAPLDSGRVLSIVVSPRTQLIADDPFAALLGLEVPTIVEPPYRLTVTAGEGANRGAEPRWTRRDDELHGDWEVDAAPGRLHAHVEVELRSLDVLFARAGLLILLNLGALGVLWLVVAVSDPPQRRWLRSRLWRWRASYRARLTATVFAAFVLPSLAFGFWTLNRLRAEDLTSRSLLVRETLRAVRVREPRELVDEAARLETPLFWYRDGVLQAAAEPLHLALAPFGYLLDPVAAEDVVFGLEDAANRRVSVGAVPTLVGYRTAGPRLVLAAPARRTELTLERQQRDVLALLLVSMAVGGLIAWVLSGLAARAFAQPISALRRAAEEVARGARELTSLGKAPPSEFRPVFQRFRQMAVELSDSRQDLERAQRVFAWGEMARQVAHEIKNPLTPIRLGVQHLRRAHADARPDFPQILDRNVERILGEIDRLDHIARSFSKFGMRPEDAPPTESVTLAPLLRDVVALEEMGEGEVEWRLDMPGDLIARARVEELREVLLNILENARLANARLVTLRASQSSERVELSIEDDGDGVSEEHLAHVFEPRFSTRTSGSGLGLAISRRLVESWGGNIRLEPRNPRGTRVIVTLVAEAAP